MFRRSRAFHRVLMDLCSCSESKVINDYSLEEHRSRGGKRRKDSLEAWRVMRMMGGSWGWRGVTSGGVGGDVGGVVDLPLPRIGLT